MILSVEQLFKLVAYLYLVSVLVGAVAGTMKWRMAETPTRLITILLFFIFSTELCSILLSYIKIETGIHHHLFSIVELSIPVCCYLALIKRLTRTLFYFVFSVAAFIIFLNATYLQSVRHENSYIIVIEGIIIVVLAVHSLFLLMISDEVYILNDPQFWFWTTQLVGWVGTILYWSLYFTAKDNFPDLFLKMQLGNAVINLVTYGLLTYAIIILPVRKSAY
jgi:hypothetical protein